ncbi:hypothetical protein A2U01_0076417, partial [Trifolium medium]|nr:hypothetical protein [Trifolium medium]
MHHSPAQKKARYKAEQMHHSRTKRLHPPPTPPSRKPNRPPPNNHAPLSKRRPKRPPALEAKMSSATLAGVERLELASP